MNEKLGMNLSRWAGNIGPLYQRIRRQKERERQIDEETADFLRLLARSFRAGLSVRQAMSDAARRVRGPLAEEISTAVMEMRGGLAIEQTMRGLSERCGTRDLDAAGKILSLVVRYGGNASDALENLAKIVDRRAAIAREARVLTAQTRFAAIILSSLPIGLILFAPSRGNMIAALRHPAGILAIALGVFLNIVGAYFVLKISDPERFK